MESGYIIFHDLKSLVAFMADSCMSSHGGMRLVVIDALYCSLPRAMRDLIDDNAPPFLVVETEIGLHDRSLLEVGRLPPRNSSLSAMGEFLASRLFQKLLMERKPTILVSASAVHLTQRSEHLAVVTPDGLRSRLMGAMSS
jgi:hypothetical protein